MNWEPVKDKLWLAFFRFLFVLVLIGFFYTFDHVVEYLATFIPGGGKTVAIMLLLFFLFY